MKRCRGVAEVLGTDKGDKEAEDGKWAFKLDCNFKLVI